MTASFNRHSQARLSGLVLPVGALFRVLAGSKPGGKMLEIGAGTGVGTCWILDGMDTEARLITVDIDPKIQAVARTHLGMDSRLVLCEDSANVIRRNAPNRFDLIFADGGAGKHRLLDEALALLRPGGIYVCDDTSRIPSGRPSTLQRLPPLMEALAARRDFRRLYIDWSSGAVVMVRSGNRM